MANFCTKCGKKLEEGKTCNCKTTTASTTNIDVKGGFNDCVNLFKTIVKKPVDAISEFVNDNKLVAGVIMIVFAALAKGLSTIASLYHTYSKVKSDWYTPETPKYLNEFFETFGLSLLRYAAIALVAYLIITMLLKGKATWKQMVAAVGVSLTVVICATLVNTVLIFIDGDLVNYIASYVSIFSSTLSIVIMYEAIKGVAEVDKNKLFLSLAGIFIGAEIIMDIVDKLLK